MKMTNIKINLLKLNRKVLLYVLIMISTNLYSQQDTLEILHISDPHVTFRLEKTHPIFYKLRKHLIGSKDSLKLFFNSVAENHKKTSAIIITGDLVDFYEAEISEKCNKKIKGEIEEFKNLFDTSPLPIYFILGNHDIGTYFIDKKDSARIGIQSFAEEARATWIKNYSCFEKGTYYKKEIEAGHTKYHLFFLDNAYQKEGKDILDKAQLDWLTKNLSETEDEPVVLFMHIYLPVGDQNNDGVFFRENKPINWPDQSACSGGLLKILNENKNIKALFVGHQHKNVWEKITFPSGNKIYQIETASLAKSTKNWRSIKFVEDKIIVSKPGKKETEVIIEIPKKFIPKKLNGFGIKVTPSGNNYYKISTKEQAKEPLPEKVKNTLKLISPDHSKITSWKKNKDKSFTVYVWENENKYYFTISEDGHLLKLKMKSYSAYEDIQSKISIVKGSRKRIGKAEVPSKALITLGKITANKRADYYTVNTPYGPKYIAVIDKMVYLINKNGQIQAADLISNGALNEHDSSSLEILKTDKEVIAGCDSLLKEYKDRFNFEKALIKLKKSAKDTSEFRFILMGDSRSNQKVWSTIVEHIDKLYPKPLFVVNTGDLVAHGYAKEYADYFIPPLLKTDIPYFIAIGNHDDGVRDSAIEFKYLFGKNSLNYFFDLGKFRFIFFDNASRNNTHGESLPWLQKILETTPKNLSIVVFTHKPPKNKKWAWHSWNSKDSKIFIDLMKKYRVKYVFLGHIHGYSTDRIDETEYTVSGGGGAELRGESFGKDGNMFHYIICDALPDGTITQKVVKFYEEADNKNDCK